MYKYLSHVSVDHVQADNYENKMKKHYVYGLNIQLVKCKKLDFK